MDRQEVEYLVIGGAGLLIVVLVMMYLNQQNGSVAGTQAGTVPTLGGTDLQNVLSAQNTQQANENAYLLQTSQNAQRALLGYAQAQDTLQLGQAQIAANVQTATQQAQSAADIASIQANAQIAQQNLQAQAEQIIAEYAAQSQMAVANQNTQAVKAQANTASQNGLFGALGGVLAGLGL
jgi:hypothetical protein